MPRGEGAAGENGNWDGKRKHDSFKVVSVQLGGGEGEKCSTRRLISSTPRAPGTEPSQRELPTSLPHKPWRKLRDRRWEKERVRDQIQVSVLPQEHQMACTTPCVCALNCFAVSPEQWSFTGKLSYTTPPLCINIKPSYIIKAGQAHVIFSDWDKLPPLISMYLLQQ